MDHKRIVLCICALLAVGVSGQSWINTGPLNFATNLHAAVLMSNGLVLLTGGYNNQDNFEARSELYNLTAKSWLLTSGSMADARQDHTLTWLPTVGLALVAGGDTTTGELNTCELFDPTTGKWNSTGSLSVTHTQHTATYLPTINQVLLVGGESNFLDTAVVELYNPSTGIWTTTGSLDVVLGKKKRFSLLSSSLSDLRR